MPLLLLAPTLRETTTAHVTLATVEMDSLVIVNNWGFISTLRVNSP